MYNGDRIVFEPAEGAVEPEERGEQRRANVRVMSAAARLVSADKANPALYFSGDDGPVHSFVNSVECVVNDVVLRQMT